MITNYVIVIINCTKLIENSSNNYRIAYIVKISNLTEILRTVIIYEENTKNASHWSIKNVNKL